MTKIGFIGAGEMGQAIIEGLLASQQVQAQDITIRSGKQATSEAIGAKFGVQIAPNNVAVAENVDLLVLAVPSKIALTVAKEVSTAVLAHKSLVVSLAAGINLADLAAAIGSEAAIARIMPNVNVAIQEGITAYVLGEQVSDQQATQLSAFLNAIGESVVLNEADFTTFSAIAGSSPAFIYLFIDTLARAGVKYGLNKKLATKIAAQAVKGSAANVLQSTDVPWALIDKVSSPGGTTIAGLLAMEEKGFMTSVIAAIDATIAKDLE